MSFIGIGLGGYTIVEGTKDRPEMESWLGHLARQQACRMSTLFRHTAHDAI